MRHIIPIVVLMLLFPGCRPKQDDIITEFPGKPAIPASVKAEHEFLLAKIHEYTLYNDSTGKTALELEKLMQHHFKEEEDFIFPQVGLLPSLADGKIPGNSAEIIALSEKLKGQYKHMNAEHQMVGYLNKLMQAAAKENHPEVAEFEKAIHKHASAEEEIYFPAAILVGEFLKIKSQEKNPK